MTFMIKKYGVSVIFITNYIFLIKSKVDPFGFWTDFLKTCTNICTRPLCVTDPEYGLYNQEIQNFGQFLPQPDVFR
jgi:hypothetical protein